MHFRLVIAIPLMWPSAAAFVSLTAAASRASSANCGTLFAESDTRGHRPTTTEYLVKVQFDDFTDTDTIAVRQGESLLSALERAASAQGWSEIPSDCRRGNCLTCTARHAPDSNSEHVQPLDQDGLSPALSINSNENDDEEFFLTCRSTVTGPGVVVHVGLNSAVWKHMYQTRFQDESTRRATNWALARVLRKAAEIDPTEWRKKTEAMWKNQQREEAFGDDNDNDEGIGLSTPEQP